jgi:GLPGLI family protein
MELLIGENYSLFQSLNTRFNDSLYNANKAEIKRASDQSELFSIMAERKKDRLKYKILKQNNKITTFSKILMDRYKYDENINFKWRILKDTLTIDTYKCNKATTNFAGRNYIAWFSREIPISNGPYKFTGLPGLIIKIYDVKKQHIFELISFKKDTLQIKISKDTDKPIQKITKKQYFNAIKTFKDDPVNYFTTKAKIIVSDEERQQKQMLFLRAGKRFKANPLELKLE